MKAQRAILDQLRSNSIHEDFERLFVRIFGDHIYSFHHPLMDLCNTEFNTLSKRLSIINSLASDFINEMRYNSYELPKGSRRNTYAIDCWHILQEWDYCDKSLQDRISALDSRVSLESALQNHPKTKELRDILLNIHYMLNLRHIQYVFLDYFPGTRPNQQGLHGPYEDSIVVSKTKVDQEIDTIRFDNKKIKETYTKDQILLLNELGVFDLPAIKRITTENKGRLFALLLNRNEKNVTEYIRNCDFKGNKQAEDNPYTYENKVAAIKQLLIEVGFFKK
ncbi:hypothetical protein GCM10028808_30370 [Spirosoma migulaei]